MKSVSAVFPPLAKVAAALSMTTEVLARELSFPTNEPPLWTEFEWHIARAVTSMHGISSLLHNGLRWEGPECWRRFLFEQRDQSIARHREIERLLRAIDFQARVAGVALVALKGAALHTNGIYSAGERPMGDIDLLVRVGDLKASYQVLELCGYAPAFSMHRHEVFESRAKKVVTACRLGEHVDNPIKIEMHTRIAERLPVDAIDITGSVFSSVAHAGLNAYPSPTSLMLHLLLHAAGNMRARAIRLIHLHDIGRMAARLADGDWEELLTMCPDGRTLWWALAPLMLTARYFPTKVPTDLFARLKLGCPWLLFRRARHQHLADVSWSNIRIAAFPGLEWSRSGREALAFMRSRIWPSGEARSELKEGAAQIPESFTVPWYGISHTARIVRWIFLRPLCDMFPGRCSL